MAPACYFKLPYWNIQLGLVGLLARHLLVQSTFLQVHRQYFFFLNDQPAHFSLIINQCSCLWATPETEREREREKEDGLQLRALVSYFMSGVDERRQTLRFILDLILPRSRGEFGLIDGLLRARKKGVKRAWQREGGEGKMSGRWPVSAAGNRYCGSQFMICLHNQHYELFSESCVIKRSRDSKSCSPLTAEIKSKTCYLLKNLTQCVLSPLFLCAFACVRICSCARALLGNKSTDSKLELDWKL